MALGGLNLYDLRSILNSNGRDIRSIVYVKQMFRLVKNKFYNTCGVSVYNECRK